MSTSASFIILAISDFTLSVELSSFCVTLFTSVLPLLPAETAIPHPKIISADIVNPIAFPIFFLIIYAFLSYAFFFLTLNPILVCVIRPSNTSRNEGKIRITDAILISAPLAINTQSEEIISISE